MKAFKFEIPDDIQTAVLTDSTERELNIAAIYIDNGERYVGLTFARYAGRCVSEQAQQILSKSTSDLIVESLTDNMNETLIDSFKRGYEAEWEVSASRDQEQVTKPQELLGVGK